MLYEIETIIICAFQRYLRENKVFPQIARMTAEVYYLFLRGIYLRQKE